MRIGTAERERAVDALTTHAAAGRLEPEEFEARIAAALSARTAADLEPLLADLPALTRADTVPVVPPLSRRRGPAIPGALRPWLTVSLVMVVIWAAAGGGYFWPVWVIGPWGVITLMSLGKDRSGGCASGSPRRRRVRRREAPVGVGDGDPFG